MNRIFNPVLPGKNHGMCDKDPYVGQRDDSAHQVSVGYQAFVWVKNPRHTSRSRNLNNDKVELGPSADCPSCK